MPDFLTIHALIWVRILAFASLFGLLFALGLETRLGMLLKAIRKIRLSSLLLANFVLMPLLAVTILQFHESDPDAARAMILLASAPFAPVVPLFVRMARGHLALASGLTGLFPIFSALLTPLALSLGFWLLGETSQEAPSSALILTVLTASITLPLSLGVMLASWRPGISRVIQKPVEWLSEAMGVISLGFLITLESSKLETLSLSQVAPTLLFYEGAFLIGLLLGTGPMGDRLVIAFGTANRNIGLAILLAASFSEPSTLLGDVLTQSLSLLALGLIHVALSRILLRSKDSILV